MKTLSQYNPLFCILPITLLIVFFIFKSINAPYSDYLGYYFGGKELLNKNYLGVYHTDQLYNIIASKGYSNQLVSYTPFPPFTSIVFSPFLWLDLKVSKIAFNCFSAFLFLITLFRICRTCKIPNYILLILPLIFFSSIKNNIFFGQAYFIVFTILAEGYLAFINQKKIIAASFWGFAIIFKIFPAFIILYLLIKKEYKTAFYTVAVSGFCLITSILINSLESWQFYFYEIIPRLSKGELNNAFTPLFQSLFMFLKNLLIYDKISNPNSHFNSPISFYIFLTIFQGIILYSIIIISKNKLKNYADFGIWVTASILLSPNGSTYSLIILLIPFLLSFPVKLKKEVILVGVLLFLCNIPLAWFIESEHLIIKFPRLLLLLLFFYVLIWKLGYKQDMKLAIVSVLLFTISNRQIILNPRDQSEYLLSKTPNIISKFSFINNTLQYEQLTQEGKRTMQTSISFSTISSKDVELINNQVYYKGNRLTNSSDWKKSPVLADSSIIYLSDKNRGPGFYTLRKLALK